MKSICFSSPLQIASLKEENEDLKSKSSVGGLSEAEKAELEDLKTDKRRLEKKIEKLMSEKENSGNSTGAVSQEEFKKMKNLADTLKEEKEELENEKAELQKQLVCSNLMT